jgi:hypothetical protein
MANANSTLPVSIIDDLHGATRRLQAFQAMLTPWVLDQLSGDAHQQSVAVGMFDMLEDVLEIQRDLALRIDSFLQPIR